MKLIHLVLKVEKTFLQITNFAMTVPRRSLEAHFTETIFIYNENSTLL